MNERYTAGGVVSSHAALDAKSGSEHGVRISHRYEVECHGPDGELKWKDEFDNLVVTTGLNKYLDATLKTGLASPAWFVGLISGPGAGNSYVAGDTMASHAGWTEFTTYSEAARQAYTPGAISGGSVSNIAAKAVFTISGGGGNVSGCFMVDDSTKGGSAGTLLGEGNFATGDRSLLAGDTLSVTVTATQTAV